ncbi:MAG: hypothetical protein LBC87_07300 [Fibromonadaceae bacterium]|jgi:hypothetical protein|nr:hypothetical protein [Fibromonadaceae bacterium]
MKISLIDYDKTRMPNLALMKISAWHKAKGDDVDFYEPLFSNPNIIYGSKVFLFTKFTIPNTTAEIIFGGTGFTLNKCIDEMTKVDKCSFGLRAKLADDMEHICPDYELYPNIDYSMGFITRGCVRNCDFCIVPKKEGEIRFNAHINEFQRHKKVVLLDNNILACKEGINELEAISKTDTKIDINQGLDSRLIDKKTAKLISELKFIDNIKTACDSDKQFNALKIAVENLGSFGVKPYRILVLTLVKSEKDIPRILEIDKLGVKPFAMGYIDYTKKSDCRTQIVKDICRWVNHKAIFNTCKDFSKYIGRKTK